MTIRDRRDSFCADVRLQQPRTVRNPLFADDAAHRSPGFGDLSHGWIGFLRLPRREGLKNFLRIGAIGARPGPSTPCAIAKNSRSAGISVETLDLSEVMGGLAAQGRRRQSCGALRGIRSTSDEQHSGRRARQKCSSATSSTPGCATPR